MFIDLKKSDIQQDTITPVKGPLDGLIKTDVTLPPPTATDPAAKPNSVSVPTPTPERTIIDELQQALATSLAGRTGESLESGGSEPFDIAVGELIDNYRILARRKSQGALTDAEFQRAVDVSTAKIFGGTNRPKTEQQLDSLVMRSIGEIAGNSAPDVALLPDIFNEPLLEQTKADLLNFGLQGGNTSLNAAQLSIGPFDPFGGVPQIAAQPLFFAIGSNLVSCINETAPVLLNDEFRISVSGIVNGKAIAPKLYNKNDMEKKFKSDNDSDFTGAKPNRFEYAIEQIPLGVASYLLLGFPYEEDQLTETEVKNTVGAIRKLLEELEPVLDAIIDQALARALAGANPGAAIAIALFRRFLESLEIRELIVSAFFSILSDFLGDLPGVNNDAFTPFTLAGTFSRGVGDQTVQATMTASVGALDANSASFPKTVMLNRPNSSVEKETIKTISNVEVREVPLGARGRYQLTTVIAVRPTVNPPA
ncbi:hypothetical protein [Roseobacter sp.]|uniref:hypothetical protein n=1 Tax=Roseobacter sp. TaxID=1907202 RepID=UPI00385C3707